MPASAALIRHAITGRLASKLSKTGDPLTVKERMVKVKELKAKLAESRVAQGERRVSASLAVATSGVHSPAWLVRAREIRRQWGRFMTSRPSA